MKVLASRAYYADGTVEAVHGDAPPSRRVDVEGVVYYHEPPYKTWDYGHPSDSPIKWLPDPSVLLQSGDWLPDDQWEALHERMRSDPCP